MGSGRRGLGGRRGSDRHIQQSPIRSTAAATSKAVSSMFSEREINKSIKAVCIVIMSPFDRIDTNKPMVPSFIVTFCICKCDLVILAFSTTIVPCICGGLAVKSGLLVPFL